MLGMKKDVVSSHEDRINNALSLFNNARDELNAVVLNTEEEITSKQEELKTLNQQHQRASNALSKIKDIIG